LASRISPAAYPRWEAELADGRRLLIAQHPMSKGGGAAIQTDVSELYWALDENRRLQRELMQRYRPEAIGEIVGLIDGLADAGEIDPDALSAKLEALDWAYVRDEAPQAIADMTEGVRRV
jgi:hypothetical protein